MEDAACSAGAFYKGRPAGSLADLATFSFHGRKGITSGEGGALVGSDDALMDRARTEHLEAEVERRAAVGGGQRVGGAHHGGELLLEGDAGGAGPGQPPGLEHRPDGLDLGLTDGGLAQWDVAGLACGHAGCILSPF